MSDNANMLYESCRSTYTVSLTCRRCGIIASAVFDGGTQQSPDGDSYTQEFARRMHDGGWRYQQYQSGVVLCERCTGSEADKQQAKKESH